MLSCSSSAFAQARVEVADARPCALDPAAAVLADVVRERGAEALGVLEHALLDQVRDGVELDAGGLAAEPQRLERDRAAAGELVEHLRRDAAVGVEDALAGLGDDAVGGAPLAQGGEEGGVARVVGRVVGAHERRVDGGAGGGQRSASPPQVQLARVQGGVADLLALRDGVDGLDREVVLDQPPVVGHALASSIASPGTR